MATQQSMEERNVDLVRRFVAEVVNERRYERIPEFFSPEYVRHDPAVAGDARGPERFEETVRAFHAGFPDEEMVVDDVFAAGDKVCLRYTVTGTHTGEFMGMEPTGEPVEMTAIAVHRIGEDGTVAETWVNYDSLGLMEQIGAVPPRDEPTAE
ncbi:ester cyclase [Halomarina pelagica]|uniref:ester cyclase n=1 Tax=Halomarina pelagica TaxID=2961599 RepID=UPI0020C58DEA|nr:ester cyclase [Halomarina sp. BND7]